MTVVGERGRSHGVVDAWNRRETAQSMTTPTQRYVTSHSACTVIRVLRERMNTSYTDRSKRYYILYSQKLRLVMYRFPMPLYRSWAVPLPHSLSHDDRYVPASFLALCSGSRALLRSFPLVRSPCSAWFFTLVGRRRRPT